MANQTQTLSLTDVSNVSGLMGNCGESTLTGGPITLPTATISVTSMASFNTAIAADPTDLTPTVLTPQVLLIPSSEGLVPVDYTGISGNSFTGCTGGTGTVNNGVKVMSAGPRQGYSIDNGRRTFASMLLGLTANPGDYAYFHQNVGLASNSIKVSTSGFTTATGRQIRGVQVTVVCEAVRTSFDTPANFRIGVAATDASFTVGTDVIRTACKDPINMGTAPNYVSGSTWITRVSRVVLTGSLIQVVTALLSQADVNNLTIELGVGPALFTPETRFYQMLVQVQYNDPPSVTPLTPSGSTYTSHPNFTWAYSDPEDDPQASFRICIVTQAQASGQTDAWVNALPGSGIPIYDSGDIPSSASAFQPSQPGLQSNIPYRVFIFCSDAGSQSFNGGNPRYCLLTNSGAGGSNQGLDFTSIAEPLLMPGLRFASSPGSALGAFDAVNGDIAQITTRVRPNLLPASDADNLSIDKSAAAVGTWAATAAGWTLTADTAGFNGAGRLICTNNSGGAGSAGSQTIETAQVPISSNGLGPILTAMIKTKPSTNNSYVAQVGVAFYSDAGGSVAVDGVVHWMPAATIPASGAWGGWNTLFVQAKIPAASVCYRLLVAFSSVVNGRAYSLSCASVTPGQLNLLDDPSAESGSTGFWGSLGGGTTVIATDADTVTWAYSQKCVDSNRGTSGTSRAQMAAFMAGLGVTGADSVFGVDVKSVAGSQVDVGLFDGSGNPVSSFLRSTTSAWARQIGLLTGAGNGAGPYSFGVKGHGGSDDIHVDNAQWEMVWPFPDGTFEGGAISLAQSVALGYPATHYWTRADAGGGTCAVDATHAHSGTYALHVAAATAEAYFTVSGYSSIAISFWWEAPGSAVGVAAGVMFFDSSGILLSVASPVIPSQVQYTVLANSVPLSWGQVSIPTINIPNGAAYARLFFTNTSGDMWIDDVVMTPTGTLAPSSVWLDGGWSMGGGLQTWSAVPPQVYVERTDGVAPWASLRIPPLPASTYIATPPAWEEIYNDYEWPAGQYGTSQTLYYRARALLANSGSSVGQSPLSQLFTPTAAKSFVVNGGGANYWLLMNPLDPDDNIPLQVKTAKFTTDENQQILMPVGRGRKVVIGDTPVFGDTIDLTLQTVLVPDFAAMRNILASTFTLCLRSPDGEFFYVRLTKRGRERIWTGSLSNALRTYTISLETVDAVP